MGIKSMQGTSSHLEYVGPKGRKRRKNCIFYKDDKCICKKSQSYLMKCVGRLCCGQYSDSEEDKIRFQDETKELIGYKSNSRVKKKQPQKTKNKTLNSRGVVSLNDKNNNLLGKSISLKSLRTGEIINIKVVRVEEESIFNRRYSSGSNFGMALRGKVIGDIIKINIVNGHESYEILNIN